MFVYIRGHLWRPRRIWLLIKVRVYVATVQKYALRELPTLSVTQSLRSRVQSSEKAPNSDVVRWFEYCQRHPSIYHQSFVANITTFTIKTPYRSFGTRLTTFGWDMF